MEGLRWPPQVRLVFGEQLPQLPGAKENFVDF
jgi:hypothetical protein